MICATWGFDARKKIRVCPILNAERKPVCYFKIVMGRLLNARSRKSMKKRCPNCRLVNHPYSSECVRCRFDLIEVSSIPNGGAVNKPPVGFKVVRRAVICIAVCIAVLFSFYTSMIFTSAALKYEEKNRFKTPSEFWMKRVLPAKFFCSIT